LSKSGGDRQAPSSNPSVLLRLVMNPPVPSTYAMFAPTFRLSKTRWDPLNRTEIRSNLSLLPVMVPR
jgi:hypothetical protein